MTQRSSIVAVASCVSAVLLVTGTAHAGAIGLPDNESCSAGVPCLEIQQGGGGDAIQGIAGSGRAIYGQSASGYGVFGTSSSNDGVHALSNSGTGVYASSTSGVGLFATSSETNAIVATNNDTNGSAATISALAGSSSGLAYYGTGGMLLSGDITIGGNLTIGGLAYNPGGTAWQPTSDQRVKKDIRTFSDGLEGIRDIRPVTFKYNGLGGTKDDGHEYVGVVAQELEKVFPSMVSIRKAKLNPSDAVETDLKVVDPSAFTYVLINAVKEQQRTIERQERRIAALEGARRSSLSASVLGGGLGTGLMLGLLPLGWVVVRRRRASSTM